MCLFCDIPETLDTCVHTRSIRYLQSISTFLGRISLSLADWLLWLVSKLQESCPCLNAELTGRGAVPEFLHGCQQSKLRPSCLPRRCLTHWVITGSVRILVQACPDLWSWSYRIQIDELSLVALTFLKSESSRVARTTQGNCFNSKQALPWNKNLQK